MGHLANSNRCFLFYVEFFFSLSPTTRFTGLNCEQHCVYIWRVSYKRQNLLTLREPLGSPRILVGFVLWSWSYGSWIYNCAISAYHH